MRTHMPTLVSVSLLLLAAPLMRSAHRHTDAWAPRATLGEETMYLPSGRLVGAVSLGYQLVLADGFWIRASSLFGDRYSDGTEDWYPWLFHMVDLATDLDPEFRAAYKYGGTMLRADGVFVDQSNLIFQKGMEELPDEWYFPFAIAMNYFMYKQDRATAGRFMRMAVETGGGPFYLRNLAASLISESNDLESALAFLQEEYRVAREDSVRRAVSIKIRETQYLIGVRDAEAAVAAYRRTTGLLPDEPQGVASVGIALPPDPLGGRWTWSTEEAAPPGSVRSSRYCEVFVALSKEAGLGKLQMDDCR